MKIYHKVLYLLIICCLAACKAKYDAQTGAKLLSHEDSGELLIDLTPAYVRSTDLLTLEKLTLHVSDGFDLVATQNSVSPSIENGKEVERIKKVNIIGHAEMNEKVAAWQLSTNKDTIRVWIHDGKDGRPAPSILFTLNGSQYKLFTYRDGNVANYQGILFGTNNKNVHLKRYKQTIIDTYGADYDFSGVDPAGNARDTTNR